MTTDKNTTRLEIHVTLGANVLVFDSAEQAAAVYAYLTGGPGGTARVVDTVEEWIMTRPWPQESGTEIEIHIAEPPTDYREIPNGTEIEIAAVEGELIDGTEDALRDVIFDVIRESQFEAEFLRDYDPRRPTAGAEA